MKLFWNLHTRSALTLCITKAFITFNLNWCVVHFDSSTIVQLCGCDKLSVHDCIYFGRYSFGYHISSDAREFDDAFSLSLWMSFRTFVASVSTSTYARLSLREKMPYSVYCVCILLLFMSVFGADAIQQLLFAIYAMCAM